MDLEGHAVQHALVWDVAELDVSERDAAVDRGEGACAGGVDDVRLEVEVFEYALEEGQRRSELDVDVEERADGAEHAGLVGDDPADGHGAANDLVSAVPVDEGGGSGRGDAEDHEEPPADEALPDLEVHEFLAPAAEPLVLRLLLTGGADKERAADAEGLLHWCRQIRDLLLRLATQRAAEPSNATSRVDEDGKERQRKERQPPVQEGHDGERGNDGDDVVGDGSERAGHDPLDSAHVARDPGDDLAGTRVREERQSHPLEVAVHLEPDVAHDALADRGVQVALSDAEEPGEDRQGDPRDHQEVEIAAASFGDGGIDDREEDERGQKADERRAHHANEGENDRGDVGAKEAGHAAVAGDHRQGVRALRLSVAPPSHRR